MENLLEKVSIETVQFTADAKLLEYINKKIEKINQLFKRVIKLQIILKLENSGQVRDKIVEMILKVPGNTIVVKEVDKSFEAATDQAIDVLKRNLIRYKEKQRNR